MNDLYLCALCGAKTQEDTGERFRNQFLCHDCLEEHTVLCTRCGERLWTDDNAGDNSTPLCQSCFDRYYTTCDNCGRVISNNDIYYEDEDDDNGYCWRCYEDRMARRRVILDYYTKPAPIFYGDGPRYFGVELEIDGGGENGSNAQELLDCANGPAIERMYVKHDGSLSDGLELVTHPMSLAYHLNEMPWPEVLQKARLLGYCSHQASTCGLHVHISRDAFGSSETGQDAAIARVLYFVEKNWLELLQFSRRTQRQLDRWAARYGYKEQPRDILDHAKKGYHAGRYTCVNLENLETVEFRIFRGTLKLNTLLATLQLVNRICEVALFLSDEEVKAMSWPVFVSGCREPELVQYLKERRLYINEPVCGEEEL